MAATPAWQDETFQRKSYAYEMALRYVWATQRQINRFTEGFLTRPTVLWDYSHGIVVPLGTERLYALYRSDGDSVVNLAGRAIRWLRRLDRQLGLPIGTHLPKTEHIEAVKLLRDIYEHWDEQVDDFRAGTPRRRSGPRFRAAHPELDWPGDGWTATKTEGVIMDNLALKQLFEDLSRIERMLVQEQRELWASVGLEYPDGDYEPLRHWTMP